MESNVINKCPIIFVTDIDVGVPHTQFGKEIYFVDDEEYFLGVYFDGEPIYGYVFPTRETFEKYREEVFAKLKRAYTFHASTEDNIAMGYTEQTLWEDKKAHLLQVGFKSGNTVPKYNLKGIGIRLTGSITRLINGQD